MKDAKVSIDEYGVTINIKETFIYPAAKTIEYNAQVIFDIDKDGDISGIEILFDKELSELLKKVVI